MMGRKRRAGAERDFERVFSHARPQILRSLGVQFRSALGLHDIEDAVQEGFLRAWRLRGKFKRTRSKLGKWIYGICINVARERCAESQLRDKAMKEIAEIGGVTGSVADPPATLSGVPLSPHQQLVRAVLAALSERDRLILLADMRSEGKPTDAGLAKMLRLTVPAGKKARQRTYKRFRATLKRRGFRFDR